MDILKYTDSELAKNFALLENHLKQAPSGDEDFCEECINKHLLLIEGLAEEGMNAGNNPKKYQEVYDFAKSARGKNYQKKGVEISKEARKIRKSLSTCQTCTLEKDLNNPDTLDENTYNSDRISDQPQLNGEPKKNMAKYTEMMYMGAGQFAAEGVKYLVETQFPAQEQIATIGGGAGLLLLPMFVKKLPSAVKTISMVAGSNLLAYGVVKMIKGVVTPGVVRAGVARAGNNKVARAGNNMAVSKFTGQPNGRVFGGPVTATNIPTQYARAGILGGAQAFEAPEHADLIRVD